MFLGNSPSRWIKTDLGTKGPALELYQELAKADSFKRNLKDASSVQFIDEFKAIQNIKMQLKEFFQNI